MLNYIWLDKVLRAGLKQHKCFIRDFTNFPFGVDPMYMLEVKYKGCVFQVPVKYLALYGEPVKPEQVLPFIKRHVRTVGFRVWIPDDEETDITCHNCHSRMRYDKDNNLFCTKCKKGT